jgi:hypothetical protein
MRNKRNKPHWTDLHMIAKYALLDAAESQGWDHATVQAYIARLPLGDERPTLIPHLPHIPQSAEETTERNPAQFAAPRFPARSTHLAVTAAAAVVDRIHRLPGPDVPRVDAREEGKP